MRNQKSIEDPPIYFEEQEQPRLGAFPVLFTVFGKKSVTKNSSVSSHASCHIASSD
jgi:hypothetical protein